MLKSKTKPCRVGAIVLSELFLRCAFLELSIHGRKFRGRLASALQMGRKNRADDQVRPSTELLKTTGFLTSSRLLSVVMFFICRAVFDLSWQLKAHNPTYQGDLPINSRIGLASRVTCVERLKREKGMGVGDKIVKGAEGYFF